MMEVTQTGLNLLVASKSCIYSDAVSLLSFLAVLDQLNTKKAEKRALGLSFGLLYWYQNTENVGIAFKNL